VRAISLSGVTTDAAAFLIALALGSQVLWARSLLGLLPLAAGLAIPAGQFNPFLLMVTFGPWLAGLVLASRQRAADQLARRARELADEREVFAAAWCTTSGRGSRELHDVVAHSLSLMVVQANAGAYLTGADPDGTAEAFDAISMQPTRHASRSTASPPCSTPRPRPDRQRWNSSTNSSDAREPPGCISRTRSAAHSTT
jgi:signal transduction histidine kinase